MASNRQQYRQHSKSTLLRAAEVLFNEREQIVALEAAKWRRRLYAAAVLAFIVGAALDRALAFFVR